jgi:hypothetical protein
MMNSLTGEILEGEVFGPCVRFKGGGSSTSTTVNTPDYAYNARMATVAEKEQNIADEYFKFYESYYQPMEKEQIASNRALIPAQTETELQKLNTAQGILGNIREETQLAKPVMAEYYKQALKGINPEEKVQQARADIASSFADEEAGLRREAGRLGIDPNSNRFMGAMANRGIEKAKAIGTASNQARNQVEQINFARLSEANQMNKRNIGIGGV